MVKEASAKWVEVEETLQKTENRDSLALLEIYRNG